MTEEQLTAAMEQKLKPGMTLDEAYAFLKKEGFTVGHLDAGESGTDSISFTRREQVDFWVHQDWTIRLEGHQGRLESHSIKTSLTGP